MAIEDASKKIDLEFQLEEVEEVQDQSSLLEEDVAKPSVVSDEDEFELEIIAKPEKSSALKTKITEAKEKTAAPLLELGDEELAEATRINSTQMLQDLPDLSVMSSEVQKEEDSPIEASNQLEDPFSLDDSKQMKEDAKDPSEIQDELEKLSEENNPLPVSALPLSTEENATTVIKFPSQELPANPPELFSDKIEEKDNSSLESLIDESEENFALDGGAEPEKFPETFKVSLPASSDSTSQRLHKEIQEDIQEEIQEEIEEEAAPLAEVQELPVKKTVVKIPIKESVHYEYDENEMLKLQSTIRHLREERDLLTHESERIQEMVRSLEKDKLTYKAELDELKIENSILKKRHANQIREMGSELSMVLEKKAIYEARVKQHQLEIQRLSERVVIDVNKVRSKEKELEGHLEILTMDSASQIQARDQKIKELKRKIDTLEFNMNNAIVSEKKWRDDRVLLEEKLHKVIKSLKDSLKNIEEDISLDISVHEIPRKKA